MECPAQDRRAYSVSEENHLKIGAWYEKGVFAEVGCRYQDRETDWEPYKSPRQKILERPRHSVSVWCILLALKEQQAAYTMLNTMSQIHDASSGFDEGRDKSFAFNIMYFICEQTSARRPRKGQTVGHNGGSQFWKGLTTGFCRAAAGKPPHLMGHRVPVQISYQWQRHGEPTRILLWHLEGNEAVPPSSMRAVTSAPQKFVLVNPVWGSH